MSSTPRHTTPHHARPASAGSFDVCVRGAGAVGSTLALALSAGGLRVALVDAAPLRAAGGEDLRTYALNARAVALLQQLRVWDALPGDAACRVNRMRVHGDAGGHLDFSAWQQCESEIAWIVDAAALEAGLAQALRYAGGVERLGGAATEPAAQLVAVCEGAHSSTRAGLDAGHVRTPYGHSGIATRLVADRPHQGAAWQWFRSPDILALLPFHRPQPDASYGLVWSVPEAEAKRLMALDDAAFEQALNAAAGPAAGQLRLAGARASWPLALGRARHWCGPGWVLAGDAAHQVHPLAGHGLNLGLADAQTLAEVLLAARRDEPWRSLGDERLLRRYERRRAAATAAMAVATDTLWQLFRGDMPVLRELRNRGMTLLDGLPPLKRWLIDQARDLR